jgi:hypothetical protein
MPPRTTTSGAGLVRALVEHCAAATAPSTSAAGSGSCGTSRHPLLARHPEQFHALYDVTAAAGEGRAPRGAGRRPCHHRRSRSRAAGPRVPRGLSSRTARAGARRSTSCLPHQGRALHALARVRPARRVPRPRASRPPSLKMLREVRARSTRWMPTRSSRRALHRGRM